MRHSERVRVEALRLLAEEGCSAREVERRLGVGNWTVARWASLAGMQLTRHRGLSGQRGGLKVAWPPTAPGSGNRAQVTRGRGRRLTAWERGQIAVLVTQGKSLRAVAAEVGCAASTISRELRRGQRYGCYDPGASDQRAVLARCRPRPRRLDCNLELRRLVIEKLDEKYSPQQIAAWLRTVVPFFPGGDDMRVSHETIYQALYVQGKGALRQELKVVKALRSGRTQRIPRSLLPAGFGAAAGKRTGKGVKSWLLDANIVLRAAEAADRAVPGHWEGDLVIGAYGRSALITLIERSSRYCLIARLPGRHDSTTVIDTLVELARSLPDQLAGDRPGEVGPGGQIKPVTLMKTLTWDQGSEMAQHARFSIATGCQVFFCDPHKPWQRGSNENLNGLIRDYYPKGTDFARVSDTDIATMQHQLNTRPRQTLDWKTPAARLSELLRVALTA